MKKHSYTTIGEIRLNDIKNNELELMQSNPEYKKTQLFIKESSKIIEQKLNSQNIQNLMKEAQKMQKKMASSYGFRPDIEAPSFKESFLTGKLKKKNQKP